MFWLDQSQKERWKRAVCSFFMASFMVSLVIKMNEADSAQPFLGINQNVAISPEVSVRTPTSICYTCIHWCSWRRHQQTHTLQQI